ncbi:uncharacterized protein LOC116339656 [Contarinia nasturtii]|uniref:uncharacterized protein LOC116339656 n=1 Tax=Contarinia nasturtii TaxID=265458 RepID=UPI0012D4BE91|nr:uncharacterized protein LOC116339656 [Contarinia nasturtii]
MNTNKTDSLNGVVKSTTKKHEKGKDHAISHKCRCAASSKSSSSSTRTASTSNTATATTTATTATTITNTTNLLRNLKDVPVREYEKLSPIPLASVHKTKSSDTNSLNEKVCSPKATNHNGNSSSETSLKQKSESFKTIMSMKTLTTNDSKDSSSSTSKPDDVLILRIGGLEKSARRLSSLSINRDNGEKSKAKIKVRTKTDPHPISSSQKLRDFTSSDTLTTVFTSTHSSSKCNCSSCKSMSSSVSHSDNHNKTKSVGTQHDANNAYDPWIRQNDTKSTVLKSTSSKSSTTSSSSSSHLTQKLANTNAKVIVITDDFKKKALNQEIFVDTKRKMLRYMKANKMTNSSRSMDDDTETDEPTKIDKQKAISKSVDNVSQLSTELDQLDNVGSVELIFISDEYLNKVVKPDVIILKNNSKQMNEYTNRKSKQSSLGGKTSNNSHVAENGQSTKKSNVDDVPRRKSSLPITKNVNATVGAQNKCNDNGNNGIVSDNEAVNGNTSNCKHAKLNRQSSGETSIDDVNNKLTSHAFQSYDEQEHLESKEIQSPTTEDIPTA